MMGGLDYLSRRDTYFGDKIRIQKDIVGPSVLCDSNPSDEG